MARIRPKQQAFVEEYLVDFNATQAAIRAGYSLRSAEVIGCQNLRKLKIQQALRLAVEARNERMQLDQDWVVEQLVENYHRAMQHHPVLTKEGEPTGEYLYNGSVANRALELLGKHVGMTLADPGATINAYNDFRQEWMLIQTGFMRVIDRYPEIREDVVEMLKELESANPS